jgi:hypothetical protein
MGLDRWELDWVWPVHLLTNVWVVCGSRNFHDRQRLTDELDRLANIRKPQAVYSGGCRGPDRYGETWAVDNKILVVKVLADWSKYGPRAGPYRNEQMALRAEGGACICFWDGKSRGSLSMMNRAGAHGLYLHIVRV